MGDAADDLRWAEENAQNWHSEGLCSLDDSCFYCRREHNAEMRAPATIDELKDVEDGE